MAYQDASNDDVPNMSVDNKAVAISAACLADGTEVYLDQEQANVLNGAGVGTFLNLNGWRCWGSFWTPFSLSCVRLCRRKM